MLRNILVGASATVIVVAVIAWTVFVRDENRVTSTKVCQVTGVEDRQHPDLPTGVQLTGRTGGITGADLGFPFEYRNELVMLFGDSREFDPDRCEPDFCGTEDSPTFVPVSTLKRWPTRRAWDTWVAHRDEGADSIAKAPVDFDPENCIPVSVETDERGSVYVHEIGQGRIEIPFRLSGEPVGSRPEDRWVIGSGDRVLVITETGDVFAHLVNVSGKTIGDPVQLSGPRVAARAEDKWVVALGNRLLVGTSNGRVFAHPVMAGAIGPATVLGGERVATRPEDKWVLAAGNRLLVVTTDGRVFEHPLAGDVIGLPVQLGGSRVAANPQDKWLVAMSNQLLVITKGGELFAHPLIGNDVGAANLLNVPWTFVGANPQDRRALTLDNRLLILTQHDGLFRPTTLDDETLDRKEGAIGAVVDGSTIYAFFTQKYADHAHDDVAPGGQTVLARSIDNGRSFQSLRTTSRIGKFLWTVPVIAKAADVPGLPPELFPTNPALAPDRTRNVVLMWGAGRQNREGGTTPFHHSYPFLAVAELSSMAVPDTVKTWVGWRYYAGTDASGALRWERDESAAQPVLPFGEPRLDRLYGPGFHECLGYFSVRRIDAWGRWVMVYACNDAAIAGYNSNNGTRGIYIRTADLPWGPWSPPQLAFDPKVGSGYCEFMHFTLWDCPEGSPNRAEASVRDKDDHSKAGIGGEYAPILLPARYAKVTSQGTTLYFLMGTWNPYQVVLMRMQVRPAPWWSLRLRSERLATWFRRESPSAYDVR